MTIDGGAELVRPVETEAAGETLGAQEVRRGCSGRLETALFEMSKQAGRQAVEWSSAEN